jgi:hypothetical protein
MSIYANTNEDLTSFVKKVIKEGTELEETEAEAGVGEIVDIANDMDLEGDISSDESEDMNVTLELDALKSLVGEEDAQALYDMCCERGPSVPLTAADVEECCPGSEEGDLEDLAGEEMDLEADEGPGSEEGDLEDLAGEEMDLEADEDVEAGLLDVAIGNDTEVETEECEAGEDGFEAAEGGCDVGGIVAGGAPASTSSSPADEEVEAGADEEVEAGEDVEAGADEEECEED